MTDWIHLFATYRVAMIRGEEVIQGLLRPELVPDHPVLHAALAQWPGTHFVHRTPFGTELTLVRRPARRPPERWGVHALLFLLTALTTTAAGAMFLGREPFGYALLPLGAFGVPVPVRIFPAELLAGLVFSVPLLIILLGHELGHYLVARRHEMDVSPPYFIPAPLFNIIGTFGAFIRLRSPMINRAMLLDVGAAGPIASFLLSIPFALAGLFLSRTEVLPAGLAPAPYVTVFRGQEIWWGGSLIFDALAWLATGGAGVIILHPLALAGWLGLFVTALNLLPLAQLDGGHILYALAGRWQRRIGVAFLGLLLVLGNPAWGGWWGWWLWAGLTVLIGRGSIRHPAVFDPEFPVTGRRRVVGWACVAILVLTFVLVPIQV